MRDFTEHILIEINKELKNFLLYKFFLSGDPGSIETRKT